MNKFSGIDLYSNNSVVVVSDDSDRVLYQRRLPNDPVQIRAALAAHREDLVGGGYRSNIQLVLARG